MPMDRKLLAMLVCPVTKQPLSPLSAARLARVNEWIARGEAHDLGGNKLRRPLQQALITENRTTIYPVEENIPILLEARGIACVQIPDW